MITEDACLVDSVVLVPVLASLIFSHYEIIACKYVYGICLTGDLNYLSEGLNIF